jgi:hypothetical protein
MPTASPLSLGSVVIGDNFTATVNIIPDNEFETISSVTGVLSGTPLETSITVTGGSTSVTISGQHLNTFTDVFTYTEPGFSDLETTPSTATGRENMPAEKNLFILNQDSRKSQTRTYILTVNGSISLSVTQEVENPLEAMTSFMANYNYKAS